MESVQVVLAPHVLVPFTKHIKCVSQDLVALELGFRPLRCELFYLVRFTVLEVLAQSVDHLAEDAIRLALLRLIGANLIDEVVDHIAQVHGVQHPESKIDGKLQAGLTRGGFDSIAVFEEQNAEAVKSGILQGKPVFGLIHTEAAWAARTSGEEDEVVQNLLPRQALFLEELEILHQVADGEIGRIALAIITELLAGLESSHVRHGQFLAAVTASLENGADQILVLPGKAAEQNRDAAAFFGGEGALHGAMEVSGLIESGNFPQA